MGRMVEEVSASLVREFLSRKGLKKTIACMDEECPRSSSSINSREDLRRVLHLEGLYKKNKVQEVPYKTLLELVVWHRTEESGFAKRKQQSNTDTQAPGERILASSSTASSVIVPRDVSATDVCTGDLLQRNLNVSRLQSSQLQGEKPSFILNANLNEGASERLALPSSQETLSSPTAMDQLPEKGSSVRGASHGGRSSRIQRGMMAGPVLSSSLEGSKRRVTRKTAGSSSLLSSKGGEMNDNDAWLKSMSHSASLDSVPLRPQKAAPAPRASWERPDYKPSAAQPPVRSSGGVETGHSHRAEPHSHIQTRDLSPSDTDVHMSTLTLDDIDDEEEELCGLARPPLSHCLSQHTVDLHPMDLHTSTTLKVLLFGSTFGCFGEEWKCQSFSFSDKPNLGYGIVQKKGGPCGVLASVQACVLQKLLFENAESDSSLKQMQPSAAQRTRCLVLAIAEILWRAGDRKKAVVAINSQRQQFTPVGQYKADGILELITCSTVDSLPELRGLLEQHISQFEWGPFGCVLLTISAILSRTIDSVRSDMDVPTTTLIGAHGYCTQELVNLLLCGRAVSNVFNDEMRLDSGNGIYTLLKGVSCHADIGLLSLFEHYNICKVGDYLKRPRHPIWVVCSESHFSVLFSLNQNLNSDLFNEATFDLYYYDGLANQQEQIRLTVSLDSSKMAAGGDVAVDSDLVPPLEHCIRTRWKNASVNWNDTEPIL
ncbi:probable ubiquitin carboxyl-terminal hydrolase MINDY-4 [Engraulis encrasicolus]|uniref:probable ubiquitin carboxyl-terminal hydrolase MINDY-4 n=1 Tax=Engraulis encrasicolus TaxID=184585 RepID=UPI002FD17763